MLKTTGKRGFILDFIPDEIICPAEVNNDRIFKLNNKEILDGNIVYIMSRELRIVDNWGFIFASQLAKNLNKHLKIIIDPPECSFRQESFLLKGLNSLKKNLDLNNIDFVISNDIPKNASALIFDFNSIKDNLVNLYDCICFEVDSHNILPARFISNKQEYSAATLRRKIYKHIGEFLTEFPEQKPVLVDEADDILKEFITKKLKYYNEFKNNFEKNMTSNLSPYLHFGFISAQRIALEIIKSKVDRINKEAFLDELIVRKELADNFCLYSKSFKTLDGILPWAMETLNSHRSDIRPYLYTLGEFELGLTHDAFWNEIQKKLVRTGKMHGYLRMYWAKKILEWSKTPEDALKTAIYFNDEYALDGKDANGYVGILWSICGLHDRPFFDRLVTGKIRYMSLEGVKKKIN